MPSILSLLPLLALVLSPAVAQSCDKDGCFTELPLGDTGVTMRLTQSVKYNESSSLNFTLACAYVSEGAKQKNFFQLPSLEEAEKNPSFLAHLPHFSRAAQGSGYACYYNSTHDLVMDDKEGTTEEDVCPDVMLC
ncbi:hypothetical protein BD626DRAFT_482887 [Schizophyllum amplum]|uniref:AA1-like domain-containing protein n=1 Tax=Schizophyllum amplum TaxID=97359 RepID=A0A550CNZ8_9AGAR|nr:hypothetical protein BD626DRAFT_482887 [Auriculariopsis ampla]